MERWISNELLIQIGIGLLFWMFFMALVAGGIYAIIQAVKGLVALIRLRRSKYYWVIICCKTCRYFKRKLFCLYYGKCTKHKTDVIKYKYMSCKDFCRRKWMMECVVSMQIGFILFLIVSLNYVLTELIKYMIDTWRNNDRWRF